jgi:hypothetical protein
LYFAPERQGQGAFPGDIFAYGRWRWGGITKQIGDGRGRLAGFTKRIEAGFAEAVGELALSEVH